jgi:RNA polymerase sigma-70 factor (ECF subfamily)
MGPETPRSDGELLRAVADRDRGALRELYDRHGPWLRARLARRCADDGVVEEVLQDTFLAVWRKPDGYRGTGDVPAWLWGIGIRRLLATVRPRRPLPLRLLVDPPSPSAEDVVLLAVEHGDLAEAVQSLSPELRAVVRACVLDGLNSREAGRLLGLPAGTVRTRMSRARTQLRDALAREAWT